MYDGRVANNFTHKIHASVLIYRATRQFYFNSRNNELRTLLSSFSNMLDFEEALELPRIIDRIEQDLLVFWADFVVVGVSSTTREIIYRFSPSRLFISRLITKAYQVPHPKSPLISFLSYVRLNICI